jgi:UDP-arabinose 4-epimerase
MNEKKYVLVTGGAGYIGSHTCKALAQAGYTPVAYDNLVYGHREAVQWGPLEEGDIADRVRLDEVFAKYAPVAVLHFAAYAYVGESVQDPGKYYRNNVLGSLVLLEAVRDHKVPHVVFSSTCASYGLPTQIPIPETHPQEPINPYGATKLMIERMLRDFDVAHGIRSISLRYFNAAGADPEGAVGEHHEPETHLIPLVLDAALGTRPHVTIFGDDYYTEDGTCVRDYIHVTDLADAHVLALRALEQGSPTTAYNLGNGNGFSVREVIASVERVTGRPVPVEVGERRAGDPPRLVGDAHKARKELSWKPQYADLDTIVRTAWEWYRKRAGALETAQAS